MKEYSDTLGPSRYKRAEQPNPLKKLARFTLVGEAARPKLALSYSLDKGHRTLSKKSLEFSQSRRFADEAMFFGAWPEFSFAWGINQRR